MSPSLAVHHSEVSMGSMGITAARHPEQVLENRRRFASGVGAPVDSLSVIGAVHGVDVARIDQPTALVPGVDGIVTDRAGVALFATFADCYPIVLFDPIHHALALGHAGWRGTQGGMAGRLMAVLTREYGADPAQTRAVIGPGICGDCYEVGPEFEGRFPAAVLKAGRGDRLLLDLRAANRSQLLAAGVDEERISVVNSCSFESAAHFSHRREPDGSRCATLAFYR